MSGKDSQFDVKVTVLQSLETVTVKDSGSEVCLGIKNLLYHVDDISLATWLLSRVYSSSLHIQLVVSKLYGA